MIITAPAIIHAGNLMKVKPIPHFTPQIHRLKVTYTIDLAEELSTLHGLDIEQEIASMMAAVVDELFKENLRQYGLSV